MIDTKTVVLVSASGSLLLSFTACWPASCLRFRPAHARLWRNPQQASRKSPGARGHGMDVEDLQMQMRGAAYLLHPNFTSPTKGTGLQCVHERVYCITHACNPAAATARDVLTDSCAERDSLTLPGCNVSHHLFASLSVSVSYRLARVGVGVWLPVFAYPVSCLSLVVAAPLC
jgi:hypothetical protein